MSTLASPKTEDSLPPSLDESDQSVHGVFEPPSGFVVAAIGRNKLLVCLLAVVLALIGTAYGLSHKKTYTASATLQVGQVNPNSPGFYNYVASAGALATAFSRSIGAEPVLATVQRKLKLAPTAAIERLSAEPIPQSPTFRVIATGPTEGDAVQLANVTANAIVTYESTTNSANPEAASLLHEYSGASLALEQAVAKLAELESSMQGHGSSTRPRSKLLAPDKAARDTAEAKLKAIAAAYTAAVTSQAPRSGLVSLLAGAASATSDRKSTVEQFGFIGLLIGIVIGCMVAVLRERRRTPSIDVKMQESSRL
jgi:Chain length determinant protein